MQHTTTQNTKTTKGKKQLTPPPAPLSLQHAIYYNGAPCTPCNKQWLLQLAKHYPAIDNALKLCSHCQWNNDLYVYFIYPNSQTGAYGKGMMLTHPTHGTIVVDMYDSGLIAGIEFLDNVLGYTCKPESFFE